MLITEIKIDLTTRGIGCFGNVIITRNKERVLVFVTDYTEFKDVTAYEVIDVANKAIKRFFEICKREYDSHIISERDREITKDFLKHYPIKLDDMK